MKPTDDQVKKFLKLVESGVITSDMLERFLENPYAVMSQSILGRLVAETGCQVANEINDCNFPVYKEPDGSLVLVEPRKTICNREIVSELRRRASDPAELPHLFSLIKSYTGQVLEKTVVALGSICVLQGAKHCPVLRCHGLERLIETIPVQGKWTEEYSFLGKSYQGETRIFKKAS